MVNKDLGMVTAYAYAVSKGYTGTEEEFAALMADYADVGERAEAAEQDAQAAKTAAEGSATAAAASATQAQESTTRAAQKASEASASATAAATSATNAEAAKTDAETAQTASEAAKDTAVANATTATTKAAEAAQSASSASDSETAAEAAATRAEQAAASLTVDSALSETSENPVQNKVVTGAVTDLKSAIENNADILDEIAHPSLISRTYTDVTPVNTHVGNRVYYNAQYQRIAQTDAGTTRAYSVYAVTPGTYSVYGFGFDNPLSVLAVVGDADIIASGAESCGLLQVIDSGVTDNYAWSTVIVDITQAGYLYVNYQTARNPEVKKLTDVLNYKVSNHGVYIGSDGSYYHFTTTKGTQLIRKFKRRGPNNLFQWVGTYRGMVTAYGVSIAQTIDEYNTDIIGPLSIWNNTLWPGVYGMWSGGNHGRTINGVVYPTAQQESLTCMVDGIEVSAEGLYYGDVIICTKNKLYFPQSITGADLSTATQALNEYRTYYLNDKMAVRVRLEFVEDTRISTYYGMQAVTIAYDTISAFNNCFYRAKNAITEALNLSQKEHKLSLKNNTSGLRLDIELKSIGMGEYGFNAGMGSGVSAGYVYIPIQTGSSRVEKVYYMLAINTTADQVASGMNLFWEGVYDIYYE